MPVAADDIYPVRRAAYRLSSTEHPNVLIEGEFSVAMSARQLPTNRSDRQLMAFCPSISESLGTIERVLDAIASED